MSLSFPGLVFFVLSGMAEFFWISPLLRPSHPREAGIAKVLGIILILSGIGLYVLPI